jgi:hypothetical protein
MIGGWQLASGSNQTLGTRRAVSQKGEAQSSLHLIFAPRNPLILFVPIFRAKILSFASYDG